MPHPIVYKFDSFILNVTNRSLSRDGQPVHLRPIAFHLLLVLVERAGETLSRSELIRIVWGTEDDLEAENKFGVTLTAVRTALEDPAKSSRFIVKDRDGYRFIAQVQRDPIQETTETSEREATTKEGDLRDVIIATSVPAFRMRHAIHILVSCFLYAALYASAVILEIAYEFDRYGASALKISGLVFVGILASSVFALLSGRKLIAASRSGALLLLVLIFFAAAGLTFAGLTQFLPNEAITLATFETYPAQAAYFKDEVYFLALALLYLIFPFHFISTLEHEITAGNAGRVEATISPSTSASRPLSVIYPRFWALASLFIILAVLSIIMTAHLLDNLKKDEHQNLFIILVYLRGVLYFGLGIECLAWYRKALNEIRDFAPTD